MHASKMYKIGIILVLATVVPLSDSCASRAFIDKNPIDLLGTVEKYTHVEGGDSDEGDSVKLNRSLKSDEQTSEDLLEQQQLQLMEQRRIVANGSTILTDDGQYKFMDEIIVLECVDWYRLEFCLNGGRCFLYPILNHTLLSCECAGDYVGERCEAKNPEKIQPTIRPRLFFAKIVVGPLVFGLALMDIVLLLFLFCKNQ